MLSEKLEHRELFNGEPDIEEERQAARSALNDAVQNLVTLMRAIEEDDLYSRDRIEEFVLSRLKTIEQIIYGMDDDEFATYLDIHIMTAIARRRMSHDEHR